MNGIDEERLLEAASSAAEDAHWTKRWSLLAAVVIPVCAAAFATVLYISQSAAAEEVKVSLAPVVSRLRACELADAKQDERITATQASAAATAHAAEQVAADVYEMRLMIVEQFGKLRRKGKRHD